MVSVGNVCGKCRRGFILRDLVIEMTLAVAIIIAAVPLTKAQEVSNEITLHVAAVPSSPCKICVVV